MKLRIHWLFIPSLVAAALPWLLWLAIQLLHPHGGHEFTSLLIIAAMAFICSPVMFMPEKSSELLSIRMTAISSIFDFIVVATFCFLLSYFIRKLDAAKQKP